MKDENKSLWDHCVPDVVNQNMLYIISALCPGNSVPLIGINEKNQILQFTNEWLYLIKEYYDREERPSIYCDIEAMLTYLTDSRDKPEMHKIIEDNVFIFATSFAKGTIHGYVAIYWLLHVYFEKYAGRPEYADYKICIYKDSQQGIKDIVYHLIDSDKIIEISHQVILNFTGQSILIPTKYHYFPHSKTNTHKNDFVDSLIQRILHTKTAAVADYPSRIAILKNATSTNLTPQGTYNRQDVLKFCKRQKHQLIQPSEHNEIEVIDLIHNCESLIVSWGTAFFKNFVYISEKCKSIYVLIHSEYMVQYEPYAADELMTSYKNAKILYIQTDNCLHARRLPSK